jgi:hypothetical protein
MAKTYNQRPSQILNLANSWAAYQFDCAALLAGLDFEAREAKGTGRRPSGKAPPVPKKDSDYQGVLNSGLPVRRMAIPENGIW